MKKNKMIVALLLALVMIFALTACGGNDNSSTSSSSDGTTPAATSDTASNEDTSSEPSSGPLSIADGTLTEADLVGQWDGDAWGIWEFRADGTALVNGEEHENYTIKDDGIYEITDSKNIQFAEGATVDGDTLIFVGVGGNEITFKRK